MRSRAFFRKVDLSSLIQLWMQLRISSSGRCAARDAERGLGRLRVGGPGGARLRPVVVDASSSPGVRAGTVERSRRSASSTPFQQRWLIILRPSRPSSARSVWRRKSSTTHHSGAAGPGAAVDAPARAAGGAARRSARCARRSRRGASSPRRGTGPRPRAASPPCSRPRSARRSRPAPRRATAIWSGEGWKPGRLVHPVARGRCGPRTRRGTASRRGGSGPPRRGCRRPGRLLAAEQLVDAVEAVELLGPLLQVVEDAVDRLVGGRGSCASPAVATTPRRERPSTRRTSGASRAHVPDVLGAGHDLLAREPAPVYRPARVEAAR